MDDSRQRCNLANRDCIPCRGGVPPLKGDDLAKVMAELGNDWVCVDEHHIEKAFRFRNFADALAFTNRVGELAESVGHHPDIRLSWGNVTLTIWTHKVDGLTESDFVLAAKADLLING